MHVLLRQQVMVPLFITARRSSRTGVFLFILTSFRTCLLFASLRNNRSFVSISKGKCEVRKESWHHPQCSSLPTTESTTLPRRKKARNRLRVQRSLAFTHSPTFPLPPPMPHLWSATSAFVQPVPPISIGAAESAAGFAKDRLNIFFLSEGRS